MTTRPGTHPMPGDVLDLHFGEGRPAEAATREHLEGCEACRRWSDEIAWAEALLAVDEEPPADGLERVLAAVSPAARPAPARRAWLRAALPCAVAFALGAGVIRQLGPQVLASGVVPEAALAPVAALSSFGLAAAAFFAAGSLVTLAIAPFLILEANGLRALRGAAR
jgi:hypothetical protein